MNPETSKLLQEAVFADGHRCWGIDLKKELRFTDKPFLIARQGAFEKAIKAVQDQIADDSIADSFYYSFLFLNHSILPLFL